MSYHYLFKDVTPLELEAIWNFKTTIYIQIIMIYLDWLVKIQLELSVVKKSQANFLAALLKQQQVSKTVFGGVFQQFITGLAYPHCLHLLRQDLIVHLGICVHLSTRS